MKNRILKRYNKNNAGSEGYRKGDEPTINRNEGNGESKKSLKRGKSTGPDNLPNEAIIEGNNKTLNIYREYLNMIIRNNVILPS